MSYSFSIVANSRDEANEKIAAELASVVNSQPNHVADRQAAQDVAEVFIGLVKEPSDSENIYVSVSGSLSWNHLFPEAFTGANVSVGVSLRPKS